MVEEAARSSSASSATSVAAFGKCERMPAPEKARASSLGGEECIYVVDKDDIQNRVGDLLEKMDLSKFIL